MNGFATVPVLYYHRIGAPDPIHLSIPAELFRRQMAFLAARGVETLSSERLLAYLSGRERLSRPAVVITFDDGFVDNLRVAGPILREFGFKALLFMITSLVRPPDQAAVTDFRPFTAAHTAARRGDFGDFLSAQELRDLEAGGTFEIHSHSHAHQQVFVGATATGVYPQDDDHWGILSAYGESAAREPELPIFPRGPGLVNPAWHPDTAGVVAQAKQLSAVSGVAFPVSLFRREDSAAFAERVRADLKTSLTWLKTLRLRESEILCWPWGATDPQATDLARAVGFRGAVLTKTGNNVPGTDPFTLCRFPVKKAGMARFALGYFLRAHRLIGQLYERLHGWL